MNIPRLSLAILLGLVACLLCIILPISPAYAQTLPGTAGADSASTANGTSSSQLWSELGPLIIPLIFGLLAFALALIYMGAVQRQYYRTAGMLGRSGKTVVIHDVEPFYSRKEGIYTVNADYSIKITGPDVLTIGAVPGRFTAEVVPNNKFPPATTKLAPDVTWRVDPAGSAAVNPTQGTQVSVRPVTPGVFTLLADSTCKVKNETISTSAKLQITAVEPVHAQVELPFIGSGYGSVLIGILLIAVILALAALRILSSEATASLLGVLAGYVFGVVATTSSSTSANG